MPESEKEGESKWIVLAIVMLISLLLRLYKLGEQSFWTNEAASYVYGQGSIADIVKLSIHHETNPPGFHLWMRLWMLLGDTSEYFLRLPCAVIGAATVGMIYYFARRIVNVRAALTAAALLAVAPLHIWYSQECRGFAFWLFFIVAGYGVFLKWLQSNRTRYLILNAAFVWLAMSVHYLAVYVLLVENGYALWWLWKRRDRAKAYQWFVSQAILLFLMVPLLAMMFTVDRSHIAWLEQSGVRLKVIKSIFFHLGGVFFMVGSERVFKMVLILISAAVLALGVRALRRRDELRFLIIAACVPLALNLLYSLFVSPILGDPVSAGRYNLLVLPPLIVVMASGWNWLWEQKVRHMRMAAALLLGAFVISQAIALRALYENESNHRDDYRGLCAELFSHYKAGDMVLVDPFTRLAVAYYAHRLNAEPLDMEVVEISDYEDVGDSQLSGRNARVWLFVGPIHHYEKIVRSLEEIHDMRLAAKDIDRRRLGVGLFLFTRNGA